MADVNMPEAKANYSATEKELALAAMASKRNDTLQVWRSCHAAHSFYGRQRRPRQFWPSVSRPLRDHSHSRDHGIMRYNIVGRGYRCLTAPVHTQGPEALAAILKEIDEEGISGRYLLQHAIPCDNVVQPP
jgi:hypothetical protein